MRRKKRGQQHFNRLNIKFERPIKVIFFLSPHQIKEFPEARLQIFGSMASGLAIDTSDMDILVSGVFS